MVEHLLIYILVQIWGYLYRFVVDRYIGKYLYEEERFQCLLTIFDVLKTYNIFIKKYIKVHDHSYFSYNNTLEPN